MSGHQAPTQEQRILTGVDTLLQSFQNTYLDPEKGVFPRLLKEMEENQGSFTTDFRGFKSAKIHALRNAISSLTSATKTVLTHGLMVKTLCAPVLELMRQLDRLEASNKNIVLHYNQSSMIASWFPSAQADEGTFGRHIQEAKNFIDTSLRSSLSPEDFATLQTYLQKPEDDLDLQVLSFDYPEELEAGYAAGDEADSDQPRQDVKMREQNLQTDDSEKMPLDPDVLVAIAAEAIANQQCHPKTYSAQSEQTAASGAATTISTQPKAQKVLDPTCIDHNQISRLGMKADSPSEPTKTAPAAAYTRPTPTAPVTMPPPPPGLDPNAVLFSFGDFSTLSSAPPSSTQNYLEQRHASPPTQSSSNALHQTYNNPLACGFHGLREVANFPPPGAVTVFMTTPHGPLPGIFIPHPTAATFHQRPRAHQHSLASQGGHTSTTPRAPQYPLASHSAYNTATATRSAHNSSMGHGQTPQHPQALPGQYATASALRNRHHQTSGLGRGDHPKEGEPYSEDVYGRHY